MKEKQKNRIDPSVDFPASQPGEKPFVSKGEKVFDEITYRGVNWLLNAAFGVAFTYWSTCTKAGKRLWGDGVYNAFRKIATPLTKNERSLHNAAEGGRLFAGIIMGGFAIIPILMGLEKNKKSIVESLDKRFYSEDELKDPKFEAAYNTIAQEPEQDFTGGLITRLIALAPILGALTVFPRSLERRVFAPIGSISKKAAEILRIQPKGLIENSVKIDNKDMSHWNFIHNTIGADFAMSLAYSLMHEPLYKGYARIFNKDKDTDKTNTENTPPPPSQNNEKHRPTSSLEMIPKKDSEKETSSYRIQTDSLTYESRVQPLHERQPANPA